MIRELCSYILRRDGGGVMIGEVNLPPHELRPYFGNDDGDELHMLFNFNLNQALFLALARREPSRSTGHSTRCPTFRNVPSGSTSCGTTTS